MEHSKEVNYGKIYNAVLCLELKHGHLKWNYSQVARLAGIHRSLIYHYFGKDKKELLKLAITHSLEVGSD